MPLGGFYFAPTFINQLHNILVNKRNKCISLLQVIFTLICSFSDSVTILRTIFVGVTSLFCLPLTTALALRLFFGFSSLLVASSSSLSLGFSNGLFFSCGFILGSDTRKKPYLKLLISAPSRSHSNSRKIVAGVHSMHWNFCTKQSCFSDKNLSE